MTVRRDPGAEDGADDDLPSGAPQRWQHPSEVGLAVRGRTDRRRSAVIAAGVLLGGLGLLVSGVLLGSMDHAEDADDDVADRIEASVANVVVVEDGVSATVTGLVLDDEGHLVVRATSLGRAEEIWARCADGTMEAASVVARDDTQDLAIVRIESPAGRPPEVSDAMPEPGLDVLAVDAVPGAVTTTEAVVAPSDASTPADRFHAEMTGAGAGPTLVFDVDGALLGMSTHGSDAGHAVEVASAAGMIGAAHRLLEG